jgi:predicted Zn-dependent peptidase
MMFQGSRDLAEDTWFKKLEAVGAFGINGTTNTERTNYFESVPSNELELALWMESDRMGFLLDHVNEESFRNQQDAVRNERRQSYEMRPYGMIPKLSAESMFPPTHPYHYTTIGEHEDLVAAKVDDVKAFFRKFYAPSNATLCIAGDFDDAATRKLIEKYFGTLPKVAAPKRMPPAMVGMPVIKSLPMEANVQLARFEYIWHGTTPFSADEPALDLLSDVLSSGKSSRLYKKLVYDLKVAQSVFAGSDTREYGGEFSINVTVKPGHTIDEVRKLVDEELVKIRKEAPAAAELDRAKAKIEAGHIRGLESASGRAFQLQNANHFTRDPGKANTELARYLAVTPEAVRAAAAKYLAPERMLVITVVPNKEAPLAGRVITAAKESK